MKRRAPTRNRVEDKMVRSLDNLRRFDEWSQDILPKIEKMVRAGATADEIYKQFANVAAARAVTIAMTATDPGKAMSAITDVMNRAHGKPKESLDIKHKYENMREEELDALLESKLKETSRSDEDVQ